MKTSLEKAAEGVWEAATRKGMLFVTDPVTGSDALVGYFVPAEKMNALGAALVPVSRRTPRSRGEIVARRVAEAGAAMTDIAEAAMVVK